MWNPLGKLSKKTENLLTEPRIGQRRIFRKMIICLRD